MQLCSWALVMADMRRRNGGFSISTDSKCLCRAPVDRSRDGRASLSCPGCAQEQRTRRVERKHIRAFTEIGSCASFAGLTRRTLKT